MTQSLLDRLQRDSFRYFLDLYEPTNGLVPDNTAADAPASIAAVGFAMASYPVGVERGFLEREDAVGRTLAALRFFAEAPHGEAPDAIGHKGFYYHFLDIQSGERVWNCELSTIDTAFLIAGALAAATYFDKQMQTEQEVRSLARALYGRADWQWALNGGTTVSHGWNPETGFLASRWEGYNEALLLYVLALGSPTYPVSELCYEEWTRTYEWRSLYGMDLLHAGPLFIHQLSHIWLDFRWIQDRFMRDRGSDYFENSRRATYAHWEYGRRNPLGFAGYGEHCWGISACDGPGPCTHRIDGVTRSFLAYAARGVPDGPDDGTVCLWAAAASLPFAPEIVLPTIERLQAAYPETQGRYGFKCSFNPTFADDSHRPWICDLHFGVNQGPLVLMIENYRSGFLWDLMRRCSPIVRGLRRAGFSGGWLGASS